MCFKVCVCVCEETAISSQEEERESLLVLELWRKYVPFMLPFRPPTLLRASCLFLPSKHSQFFSLSSFLELNKWFF